MKHSWFTPIIHLVLGFSILLFLSIVFSSCKKGISDIGQIPPPPPPTSGQINESPFIVDTLKSNLMSSAQEVQNGIYRYNQLNGADTLQKGDIFIDQRGFGHLRIINTITKSNNEITLTTTQGTLSDVFKNIDTIKNNIPLSGNPFGKINLIIPDFKIAGAGWGLEFSNMNFTSNMGDNAVFDFSILKKYIKVGFENVSSISSYNVKAKFEIPVSETKSTYVIKSGPKRLFLVGPVPCFVAIDLVARVTVKSEAKVEAQYNVEKETMSNMVFTSVLGVNNMNVGYQNKRERADLDVALLGEGSVNVEIYPSVRLWVTLLETVETGIPNLAVDANIKANLTGLWNAELSAQASAFIKILPEQFTWLPNEIKIEKILSDKVKLIEVPKNLKVISGSTQNASPGQQLKDPIIYKVFDNLNLFPQKSVKVFFSSNLGTWGSSELTTSILAKEVSNRFTLGNSAAEHILVAAIKNGNGDVITRDTIRIKPDDELALLRAKTWVAINQNITGSSVAYCLNTALSPPVKTAIFTGGTLRFSLNPDGSTQAQETITGIEKKWKLPIISNDCWKDSSVVRTSSGKFIKQNSFYYYNTFPSQNGCSPSCLPPVLWNMQIVSISATRLILTNTEYGPITFNAQ